MIVIIYHRDSDRQIIQRFPNLLLPPLTNQRWSFSFDQSGKSTHRIGFGADSQSGSGPINGEVDDIEFLARILQSSDDLKISNVLDRLLESLNADDNNRSISNEPTLHRTCKPDTIPLRSGFIIEGGTTPYSLAWDLDGDGLFDDAFGDSIFLTDLNTGLFDYALEVSDAGAEKDTARFTLETIEPVQHEILFPDQESSVSDQGVLITCIDDGLLRLRTDPPGGLISGTGIVNDAFFDPLLAGSGGHVLTVSGNNLCDLTGLATINVQSTGDPSWETFSISTCDAPIVLKNQITGDTTGDWYINGLLSADAIFDPASFSDDSITITYAMGLPPCNVFETRTLIVDPVSDPTLTVDELNVDACAGAIDLNTLLVGDTSGTWSGGSFIQNDTIDPMLLDSGSYQ
ncbi:MAG: hypothetical protein OEQ53_21950, partial [Saprospiraceae bacterium]|nr:hypothetical protein [Saprospiraceae bacterium]